jgi:hypothetical protein
MTSDPTSSHVAKCITSHRAVWRMLVMVEDWAQAHPDWHEEGKRLLGDHWQSKADFRCWDVRGADEWAGRDDIPPYIPPYRE